MYGVLISYIADPSIECWHSEPHKAVFAAFENNCVIRS